MAQTVIGMFKYQEGAENAIKDLKDLNYKPSEISVLMKDVKKREEVKGNVGTSLAKGATTGAAVGGALAGAVGLLVGLGVFTVPGLGALLLAGPISAALGFTGVAAMATTAAVSGVLTGGLVGGLIGVGFSHEDAQKYEEFIRAGGIVLIIPARDRRTDEVRGVLAKHGATDVRQLELHPKIEKFE